ncbi:methionine aminotransferase [Haloflavibacter putidus]|uniref:Aminotransferase class I/II-fold pyridoxal phosphate-dependent enzyme n=1 Tax=Haloflavibacter putidus TaxID=2576776 RepID=A0A507ZSU5_9FLAO|nr:methionine aminotransferase [Haloflavibacter putidus]TQD39593.1 aminotransferase class I/II-fold pyridoxal phosphate-dependent enzyme [Haloflavibacter putidus]
MKFTSKLPNTGTTIFTEMSNLANKHEAINLSQGFPDYMPDSKLLDLVEESFRKAGKNQYAPLPGIFSLRKTLCNKLNYLYNSNYHPETDITITAGATQAIFTAISTFVKKDDEVIVFKPAYDCYEPAIELYGGKPVLIQMKAPDYSIDWEAVEQKVSKKTRMIIINTPHNPTGKVLKKHDLLKLQEIVSGTDVLVLSDEVYEHIVFDEHKHQSVARFIDLRERSFITYSFGKTFHVTGWKLGYCVAPKALMKEFQKVHQYNVFCVNHPLQIALNQYLQKEENYLQLAEFYQQKRDYFLDLIKDSRLTFTPSEGTYFQTASYKTITKEKDTDYAIRLIKEKKLASIPVSVFNKNMQDDKVLRFCFAKQNKTLEAAAEIINTL